jgi:predicted Zn finger-like uncharacterized protein
MIVTCPQCQTRFRIPDDKVTAKGVKVRCTRCRHTFRVSRPSEPLAPPSDDPFAQFAPSDALSEEDKTPTRGTPLTDARGIEVEPAGPPPADDFDVDVETPDGRRNLPPPAGPDWGFPPPPPPAAPPSEPPDVPTPRIALARIATVRQVAVVRPKAERPPPDPRLDEAAKEDLGTEDTALGGPADDPLELDTGSPHASWQGSTDTGFELPSASGLAELDFGDLNAEAAAPPLDDGPPTLGGLDFDSLDSEPGPAALADPAPLPAAPIGDAFGDLDLEGTPAPRPTMGPPPAAEPRRTDYRALPGPSFPTPAPEPEGRTAAAELFGQSATPLDEEPFPAGPGTSEVATAADRAALFDMPEAAQRPGQDEELAGPTSLLADVPDAVPDAPPPPPVRLPPTPTGSVSRVTRPPSGTSVLGLEERRELGAARRLSGAVGNIGVAAVLVVVLAAVGNVYVNEGRLDWSALSPRRWASLFVPPRGIVTLDVSNGLYETRGIRPLAYVRGRVENRGQHPGQVLVRAEIWDGSQLLGTSEGLAGVLPTPEEMVEASTKRDVEMLRARLQRGAPALAPGKGADFVLLFDEPPTEVTGLRLRVSAAAVDGR